MGETFTVNVSIIGATNLFGYQFKLFYNSTALDATIPVQEGPFLKSGGGTFFQDNSTPGMIFVYCTSTNVSSSGVNGNGVLATINFTSAALSNAIPLQLSDVGLSDPNSYPLPYQLTDGTVTITPEFNPLAMTSALVAISFLTVFIARKTKSKRSIH
jgi:hypothetical protein